MSDQSTLQPPDVSNTSQHGQKKRSRATAEQLAILEDTFAVNVSPNSKLRAQLSAKLNMSERRYVMIVCNHLSFCDQVFLRNLLLSPKHTHIHTHKHIHTLSHTHTHTVFKYGSKIEEQK